jgi:NAD(P)-dependent dehydrogenase (short-subunit alcohol dehydrogenase family)
VCVLLYTDITEFGTFDKTVHEVENIVGEEGLNVLINNEGINKSVASINDITVENLKAQYLTNTVGPIMLTKVMSTKCILHSHGIFQTLRSFNSSAIWLNQGS